MPKCYVARVTYATNEDLLAVFGVVADTAEQAEQNVMREPDVPDDVVITVWETDPQSFAATFGVRPDPAGLVMRIDARDWEDQIPRPPA